MHGIGATAHPESGLSAATSSWIDPFVDAARRQPGRIVISWSMGGGIVGGGLLIAAMTLANRLSSSGLPQLSLLLFALGAGAGIAHGGLLGYLCRDPARTRTEVLGVLLRALLWAIPGMLASWAAAFWISLTAAVLHSQGIGWAAVAGILLSWLIGLSICAWAAWEGARGMRAAWQRWPDIRIASVVISVVFAVLATAFTTLHPQIWWTDVRVTGVGALILAFGATVWIALPVVIAALGLMHRLTGRS
jgi:hypothetical protein